MSTLRRIWTVPSARISIIILLGVAVLVVAGSALAPYDPLEQDPTRMLQGPGSISCSLPPSPSTAHHISSVNQQINARGLGDKRWRQCSVEKLLCLDKFFLGCEGANHTV